MLANNIPLEALKEYFQKKYDINTEDINCEKSLLYGLEIKGDDVDDFFSSLIKDFKIEVKRLNLSRFYVGEEPFDFLGPIIRLFKIEKISQKPTITISDIEMFIQSGILE